MFHYTDKDGYDGIRAGVDWLFKAGQIVIGRTDVLIETRLSPADALDLCARRLADLWPDCIFEDAETAAVYCSYGEVPFGQTRELIVYRDRAAFES